MPYIEVGKTFGRDRKTSSGSISQGSEPFVDENQVMKSAKSYGPFETPIPLHSYTRVNGGVSHEIPQN
jgi:hypothetical protein